MQNYYATKLHIFFEITTSFGEIFLPLYFQLPHLRFVTLRFRHQKCHTYGSKLPYFWVVSMGVLGRKPQGYGWGSGGKGMLFFETKKEIT